MNCAWCLGVAWALYQPWCASFVWSKQDTPLDMGVLVTNSSQQLW